MTLHMPTQRGQRGFQSVSKTNEEEKHLVVSHGKCKQDFESNLI